jgi:N utilization substance protein B
MLAYPANAPFAPRRAFSLGFAMSRRSRSREVALQVLYQDDLNGAADDAVSEQFLAERLKSPELIEFAKTLLAGVRLHRATLDGMLEATADNWSLGRMAVTDRNVLRLGAYELVWTDTPERVVINEAVELAKRYGSRQSAQFVNGILDRLLHEYRGAPRPDAPR